MPSKSNLFHSHRNTNRSDISVASQDARDDGTLLSTTLDHHQEEGLQYLSEERQIYQLAPSPTRSQSHRLPTLLNTNTQPSISLHSTPNSALEDENPDRYYQQSPRVPVHKAEQKKRRFFGIGGSSKESSKDKTEKFGRSTSVRRKDQPQQLESHSPDTHNRTEQQSWSSSNALDDEEEPERCVLSQKLLSD